MYCKKCGTKLEVNKPCLKCGNYISEIDNSQKEDKQNIYFVTTIVVIMLPMVIATVLYALASVIANDNKSNEGLVVLATMFVVLSLIIFGICIVKGFKIREKQRNASKTMITSALGTIVAGLIIAMMLYWCFWVLFNALVN